MDITLTIIASYLLGSIPNAYILAKIFSQKDLRSEGSKNIGARNAYEVTNNKMIGAAVLVLDILKGLIPVWFLLLEERYDLMPITAVAVVLGHCYSIWIRFHGGRGLATAAAISALLSPILLPAWILFYFLCAVVRKNVHFQALIATFATVTLELVLYEDGLTGIFSIAHWQIAELQLLHYSILAILFIIISRHVQPVSEHLKAQPL